MHFPLVLKLCFKMAVVVLALALALAESNGQAFKVKSPLAISDSMAFPGSWVSDMFYEVFANFTVRDVGTIDCQKHSDIYDVNLKNYTSWAIRSKYSFTYE